MFPFVLSLGLLTVASSRQHILLGAQHVAPQRIDALEDASKLRVEIPAPERRNPDKCELFETSYAEDGCSQSCAVDGYFANSRIRETQRRQVSRCRAVGSHCIVSLARNSRMNVSIPNGRCTSDCRCVPWKQSTETLLGLEQVAGALVSKIERRTMRQHRVRTGVNHYGKLRIHLPPRQLRNASVCEDYEQQYYAARRMASLQCRDACSVRGYLGRLEFSEKPRVLDTSKTSREGMYCTLSLRTNGKLEVRGAEQVVNGRCRKGVCRPHNWVETPATSPERQLAGPKLPAHNTIRVGASIMKQLKDSRDKLVNSI